MKETIDIYKLSEGNEGKGSIRVALNPKLKSKIKKSIKSLNSYGEIKKFCDKLGISYFVFWDYLNRRDYIPLFVLEKLEGISNIDFKEDAKYLESGLGKAKRKVKVPCFCEEFASIIGAFIADGHLKIRETRWNGKRPIHYEIVFREGYESNIIALANWINKIFEINIKASARNPA